MANENLVGYPTGGITAFAPRSAASPTKVQMADPAFQITSIPGWVVLGLRSSDGAPEWAESPAALEETYEEGYKFSPSNGTLSVTQTLVELNPASLALLRNATYTNGVADIDIDAVAEGKIYTEDRLRTKVGDKLERFMAPRATVAGLTNPRKARGSMSNRQVTIAVDRSDELDGRAHFRHAIIAASGALTPFIEGVSPLNKKIGDTVVIKGARFTGATGVTINTKTVVSPLIADDATIVAVIPAASTGIGPVVVTTPAGASNGFSYTVVP